MISRDNSQPYNVYFNTIGLVIMLFHLTILNMVSAKTLHEMYDSKQFSILADSLIRITESVYSQTPEMYMLIVDCLSLIPGREQETERYRADLKYYWGIRYISDLEKTEVALSSIDREVKDRRVGSIIARLDSIYVCHNIYGSGGVTSHKLYWHNFDEQIDGIPAIHESIKKFWPVPPEVLSARLFELGDTTKIWSILPETVESLKRDCRMIFSEHFIIISSSPGLDASCLRVIAEDLERFHDFYVTEYNIQISPYFITVYLVPTIPELVTLAKKIHGFRISRNCIGYNYRNDMSISGVIWRMVYGTLTHELFHVMVRSNFGNIPPWLDEGMAALYEEYDFVGKNKVIGKPNWRGERILAKTGVGSIGGIVQMNADEFHNPESENEWDIIETAINHATARYFVLWLQDTGKLTEVYMRLRNIDETERTTETGKDVARILVDILGDLDSVQNQFKSWFETKHPH